MIEAGSSPRLALLIDADNVPAACAKGMIKEAALLGQLAVMEAFGDFQLVESEAWSTACAKNAIKQIQLDRALSGKNAADIALAIRAVDLLHGAEIDGLVLASGDTDFVPLLARFRENGLPTYVFGQKSTPERLRDLATRFVFVENLAPGHPVNAAGSRQKPLRSPEELRRVITDLVTVLDDGSNWASIRDLEQALLEIDRHFDVRSYGYRHLIDFCGRLPYFVIDTSNPDQRIRMKSRYRKGPRRRSPITPA